METRNRLRAQGLPLMLVPLVPVLNIHLTDRAKRVLSLAEDTARRAYLREVEPEHLLFALAKADRGVARLVLEGCGLDLAQRISEVPLPDAEPPGSVRVPLQLDAQATHAIAYAKEEAARLNHNYVGTEHLLLGLLRLRAAPAAVFLKAQGITVKRARSELVSVLG